MSAKRSRTVLVAAGILIGALLLLVLLLSLTKVGESRQTLVLGKGSTLMIEPAFFGATNFQYTYEEGNRFLRKIAPILPPGIRKRFSFSSSTFSYGGDGSTNLYVVSITKFPKSASYRPSPGRLRVLDEAGNQFDVAWGANTSWFPDLV